MKQMTCTQMGGPDSCDAVISGNTPDEMVQNGMEHVNTAHPKMAEDMKTMPREVGEKWMAEFQEKWKATPDM